MAHHKKDKARRESSEHYIFKIAGLKLGEEKKAARAIEARLNLNQVQKRFARGKKVADENTPEKLLGTVIKPPGHLGDFLVVRKPGGGTKTIKWFHAVPYVPKKK